MQKKKNSGLAKKVPAIFEGLPDLENKAAAPAPAAQPAGVRAEAPKIAPQKKAVKTGAPARGILTAELTPGFAKFALMKPAGREVQILKSEIYILGTGEKKVFDPGELGKAVEDVLKEWKPAKNTPARLLMRGFDMAFIMMEKPDAPAKQMKDAVLWQLADKSNLAVEQAELYYEGKGNVIKVAAVDKVLRDAVLEPFHEHGIYPELVTVSPAAYEALEQKTGMFRSGNILLAELGEDQSGFAVFRKGELGTYRETAVGEDQIVRSMRGTLSIEGTSMSIDYDQAKTLLDEFGLPTAGLAPDPNEPKLSQLSARVRPVFEKITQEIRSTVTQYQKQFPADKITEIALTGVGEKIKGIDVYFSAQLNLPVRRLDLEPAGISEPAFTGLSGLALTDPRKYNFAALEDLWKPRMEALRGWMQKGIFISAALLALAAAGLFFLNTGRAAALKNTKARLEGMGSSTEAIELMRSAGTQIEAHKTKLKAELPPAPYMGGALRALSHLVAPDMVLTGMDLRRKGKTSVIDLRGFIPSGNADRLIAEFLEKLNKSPFFASSSLENREVRQSGGVDFVVQADLVQPREYLFERR